MFFVVRSVIKSWLIFLTILIGELQGQQTYIQLAPRNNQLQEENPLIKLRQQKAALIKNYSQKPRYPYGEVIIEWKQKKDIDAKGNACLGGFIYIHFLYQKKS